MATPSFWFGSNAISGTVTAAISALGSVTGTKQCLVIFWDDIGTALNGGGTATPDSGEDWLAAINYNAIDVTTNNLNSTRKASATAGSLSVDQGFYIPGETFNVYPVTVSFYVPATQSSRPPATGL
jgi:hypothetical protein